MDIPLATTIPSGLAVGAIVFTWRVSSQVSTVLTEHKLLWKWFEAKLAIDTHRDTTDPELMQYDALVEKFIHDELSSDEMTEFKRRLRGLAQIRNPDGLTAKILLASLEQRQKKRNQSPWWQRLLSWLCWRQHAN
jgi:hypothetical protein